MNINEVARNTRPKRYQRHVEAFRSWEDKPLDYEFWLEFDEFLINEGTFTNHGYLVIGLPCKEWLGLTDEEKQIALIGFVDSSSVAGVQ